jgi:hypothetical protein
VYGRRVAGRTLAFGVSGMLYRNSLVLYDRQTGTLWSHLLGVGIKGPLAGTRLETIPSELITWRAWRRRHPSTRVLGPGQPAYDAYEGYYRSEQRGILRVRRQDERVGQKELVLAVLAPAAKAYAFRDLEQRGRITDTLAGRPVEVVYDPGGRSASAFDVTAGRRQRLPSTPIFWFAYVDLFPGAPLWAPPTETKRASARETVEPAGTNGTTRSLTHRRYSSCSSR